MESQQIPIDDLRSALSAHLTAQSGRYGLYTDTFRLEPFSYSAVETTRSFTARDHDRAVQVKLWHTEQQAVRGRWLAVHEILESRHNAPRVLDTVDLPEVDAAGLIFEHIKGVHPTGQAATYRLLRTARRLHVDEELAEKLGLAREPSTVGQYFKGLHIQRLETDINIIRNSSPSLGCRR